MPAPALPLTDHIYSVRIAAEDRNPDEREQVLLIQANHVVVTYLLRNPQDGKFPVSHPAGHRIVLPTVSWNQIKDPKMLRRSTEEDLA